MLVWSRRPRRLAGQTEAHKGRQHRTAMAEQGAFSTDFSPNLHRFQTVHTGPSKHSSRQKPRASTSPQHASAVAAARPHSHDRKPWIALPHALSSPGQRPPERQELSAAPAQAWHWRDAAAARRRRNEEAAARLANRIQV